MIGAAVVFASGFALFLLWDLVALRYELYERGRSELMTGIEVAPELPVEELRPYVEAAASRRPERCPEGRSARPRPS